MRCIGGNIWLLAMLVLASVLPCAHAEGEPAGLPRYDLQIHLNVPQHSAKVRQIVTWTNRTDAATKQIVFNAHSHYSIPDKDIGYLAKTLEILRMSPREAMSFDGPALHVQQVSYRRQTTSPAEKPDAGAPLPFDYREDNSTALVVPLPEEVRPGESVTLTLDYEMKLPPKKGRWGQWEGITTLAQWIPVVAVYDSAKGWQPTPFIPWHQPFFNEAGIYSVQVTLPCAQKLAASAAVRQERDLGNGWKEVTFEQVCVRDFALIASARFQEWTGETDGIKIRCLALPEHEFYAKMFVDVVREAIPVYNRWFGKYPYTQFTVAESCFGWNGNECGGLVMIDDRMFNMPHVAKNYPSYLLQHELCHQWWYNVVGTNGYSETWMDEGLATYFSHRLANQTMGKNNTILTFPSGLGWLPNIQRDDLRNYGMIGTWARGEAQPCVQDMPAFGHLVNLTSGAYDRGSKVVGMIEERLGEAAFFDFMRGVYRKYQFRILRVADFRAELEAYTGHSWEDFFRHWVYGSGQCDWVLERIEIDGAKPSILRLPAAAGRTEPVRVVVHVRQQGAFNEPTTLGFRLVDGSEYQVRVPILPNVPVLQLESLQATVFCTMEEKDKKACASVKVEIVLPCEPLQVSVDPDQILMDERPTNNHWKQNVRWHITPLLTQLDEVDVTNAYDRWNINAGPWVYLATYNDPWFTRSDMAGLRASVYRTQEFTAGSYLAYRTNDHNIVAGTDALWSHAFLPALQLGMNVERALGALDHNSLTDSRGVVYARYVLMYGSSLYMPPFEYVETFAMIQERSLPDLRDPQPGTDPYHHRPSVGINYHKNLMTPYWDAEGGYSLDLTYQYGLPIAGNQHCYQEAYGQVALVKGMPKFLDGLHDGPVLRWLYDTRFAFRLGGAAGLPGGGLLFPLGGADNFRGFDLSQRQGNLMWVGSVEWRVPVATNLHWDFCDHILGVRNIYLAPFYDAGNAFVKGQEYGTTAQAAGVGFRVDVTWLGLIERTMLRLDVAKSFNNNTPFQFWFGLSHPF